MIEWRGESNGIKDDRRWVIKWEVDYTEMMKDCLKKREKV